MAVARVLAYWESVERYTAPIAEDDGDENANLAVAHILEHKDAWPLTINQGKEYRHFVRFGITAIGECDRLIINHFLPDQAQPDRAETLEDQYTFAGTFAVSEKGAVEKGSLVVSRFLYDLAALVVTPHMSFKEYSQALADAFNVLAKRKSKPVAVAEAMAERAFTALQLPNMLRAPVKCVVVTRSRQVVEGKAKRTIRDARVFANVYPHLLREMRSDVENGVCVGAAWDVLTKPSAASDFDATSDETVLNALGAERYPSARWPSDFSLSTHQQVAVNELFARLSKEGTFSINGPPGTGKTTLLMDVIAEIIARRADLLVRYDDPCTAFRRAAGHGPHFEIDTALHDFLVAIASSNNGAVSNLTLELPKRSKIGSRYKDALSSFSKPGEQVMAKHQVTAHAWGAISIPLGNKQNRDRCSNLILEMLEDENLFDQSAPLSWDAARKIYSNAKAKVDEIKAKHLRLHEIVKATDSLKSASGFDRNLATVSPSRKRAGTALVVSPSLDEPTHPMLALAAEQIQQAMHELGDVILPADFRNATPLAKAQMLVGTSTSLEEARADLFVAAIKLHQSFIFAAWDRIKVNLAGWVDLNSGSSADAASSANHLWSSFSLLFPVVSSTFCSFANSFQSLDRGSIPWLIVDEAGQASSHHAIDALSRAKRAVVVGDPSQLEPICTISSAVDNALASKFEVAPAFRCKSTSLQTLADRVNPFGANRRGKWIGAPLLVHRRCAEPMFSISNSLAYDKSMVLADNSLRRPVSWPSAWINVVSKSEAPNDVYIPEEGQLAGYVISRLVAHLGTLPDLFALTPFRKVSAGLKQYLMDNASDIFGSFDTLVVEKWVDRSVGTVHAFQGREADTVLFVLGGQHPASINWTLEKPNIINVAMTRARHRILVIGNRGNWFQDELRDAWMLGNDRDWLMEEADVRAILGEYPLNAVPSHHRLVNDFETSTNARCSVGHLPAGLRNGQNKHNRTRTTKSGLLTACSIR